MAFSIDKTEGFEKLCSSAAHCQCCPRLCGRKKVLSSLNGSIDSRVIFIAEAPGRLGAECTGIPLFGDRTGDNFEMLLSNIGWDRSEIFVTNSILCNPQDEKGNNSTPQKAELKNCSSFLKKTIDLIDPDLIVTLGTKALDSLKLISDHNFILKEDVATCLDWNNRKLFPLYHMGPRALIHRNLLKQRGDFIQLSHLVDPRMGMKEKSRSAACYRHTTVNAKISEIVCRFMSELREASMFKITKLLYLMDLKYLEAKGASITGAIYLRMQEGPWIPNLRIVVEELQEKEMIEVFFEKKKPFYKLGNIEQEPESVLTNDELSFVDSIIERYGKLSDGEIKTRAYVTAPMKFILKREKEGANMSKVPVLYRDKTVLEKYNAPKQLTMNI